MGFSRKVVLLPVLALVMVIRVVALPMCVIQIDGVKDEGRRGMGFSPRPWLLLISEFSVYLEHQNTTKTSCHESIIVVHDAFYTSM